MLCSLPIGAVQLRDHTVVLDAQNKIIPWYTPTQNAFGNYLDKTWAWAIAAPLDQHGLPISYLYCAWKPGTPPTIDDTWENDVGEKIPMWIQSARHYYDYSGDMKPLNYVKGLVDYSLVHGQTPSTHAWPDFPVGTSNAGDTEFKGFTPLWKVWDCHLDLASDIAYSLYIMYQIYGEKKYLDKAIHVADLMAKNIVPGTETNSPWPYVINSVDGANRSRYCSNWDGALLLFDFLIEDNQGDVAAYEAARTLLKAWILKYPMQNGKWVDGHSDNYFDGSMNLSTNCANDIALYLLDHPDWDPNFKTDVPKLNQWIEDNFVNIKTPDNLPGVFYGAHVPGEQTAYLFRMGYGAARLAAQYAQWYLVSGNPVDKDLAYRGFSYNTYMMQSSGQSADGPTDGVGFWWSDVYGDAPRMYYYGLGAFPEWAPSRENHILYSFRTLKNILYSQNKVEYTAAGNTGTETLRLTFQPTSVLVNSINLPLITGNESVGYTLSNLGNGDYALVIKRAQPGKVVVSTTATGLNLGSKVKANREQFIFTTTPRILGNSNPARSLPRQTIMLDALGKRLKSDKPE